ncbi:hypothetical protein Q1695_000802 [Nippostrongylus brasiliensis]|nr:hypothetical protein Q1695_000802 [Nippostrongylus brasiliensis]
MHKTTGSEASFALSARPMKHFLLVQLLTAFTLPVYAKVAQFSIEPTRKAVPTYVTQLVQGRLERIEQGSKMTASVSLVYDNGYYVLVDTPSSTDLQAKETMLRSLSTKSINPGEVQLVVTTHGHPDHFGQGNFFPNARHFFGSYEYADDIYIKTELDMNDTMKITANVELWNTPGHTAQDISVIVSRVSCCGTVAVVGDLFYDEADALNETSEWFNEAWNPVVGRCSRDKVICRADYIIPGHGKLFRVNQQMRKIAKCDVAVSPVAEPTSITQRPYTFPSFTFTSTQSAIVTPAQPYTNTASIPGNSLESFRDAVDAGVVNEFVSQAQNTVPLIIDTVLAGDDGAKTRTITKNHGSGGYRPQSSAPLIINTVLAGDESSKGEFNPSNSLQLGNEGLLSPVVEKAALQLAKLLRVSNDAVSTKEQYPFTDFWQNTMQRITKDVDVNNIISRMSMSKLGPMMERLRKIPIRN